MSRKLKLWLLVGGPTWALIVALVIWDRIESGFMESGFGQALWAGAFAMLGYLPFGFIQLVWQERKKRQEAGQVKL